MLHCRYFKRLLLIVLVDSFVLVLINRLFQPHSNVAASFLSKIWAFFSILIEWYHGFSKFKIKAKKSEDWKWWSSRWYGHQIKYAIVYNTNLDNDISILVWNGNLQKFAFFKYCREFSNLFFYGIKENYFTSSHCWILSCCTKIHLLCFFLNQFHPRNAMSQLLSFDIEN